MRSSFAKIQEMAKHASKLSSPELVCGFTDPRDYEVGGPNVERDTELSSFGSTHIHT